MAVKLRTLFVFLCLLVASTFVKAKRGYILTSPRVLRMEEENKLHLRLYDLDDAAGIITIELYCVEGENERQIAEKMHDIFYEELIDLPFAVPLENCYEAKIRISLKFETDDKYSGSGEENVNLLVYKSTFIWIQTDKSQYKPGQEVKFRIFLLDTSLRPYNGHEKADLWIEDAERSQLANWTEISIENGIKQFEYILPEKPNFGIWNIKAILGDIYQSVSFVVNKYAPKKFEVIITPPKFVLTTDKNIPLQICAKYIDGTKVNGMLKFKLSEEDDMKPDEIKIETEIDGCYKYEINVALITKGRIVRDKSIKVVASVIEEGTDAVANSSYIIKREIDPLKMTFLHRPHFKPGLPIIGKLKVTYPEGTPAPREPVEICFIANRERIFNIWTANASMKKCANFTSNEEGIVKFILPPQHVDSVNLDLEAKSTFYQVGKTSTPATKTFLRSAFSPSGSHLQIVSQEDPFPCGSEKKIRILFTSKEPSKYKFYYEVFNNMQMVYKGSIEKYFDLNDDVSSDYKAQQNFATVKLQTERLRRDLLNRTDCLSSEENKYLPPIGEVILNLDMNSTLTSTFYLLVYYIKDDREIVADSEKILVENCFQNKVKFNFTDKEKQPGDKTLVKISASPNSICGVKVVDKTVALMNTQNQLAKEEVFKTLDALDQNIYIPHDHCYDPENKHSNSEIPPDYEDAMSTFEMSGNIVISDFILSTRPCKKKSNPLWNPVKMHKNPIPKAIGGDQDEGRGHVPFEARMKEQPFTKLTNDDEPQLENFFRDVWLFQMEFVGKKGEKVTIEQVPLNITEWWGSAVCVSHEDGLGISGIDTLKGI